MSSAATARRKEQLPETAFSLAKEETRFQTSAPRPRECVLTPPFLFLLRKREMVSDFRREKTLACACARRRAGVSGAPFRDGKPRVPLPLRFPRSERRSPILPRLPRKQNAAEKRTATSRLPPKGAASGNTGAEYRRYPAAKQEVTERIRGKGKARSPSPKREFLKPQVLSAFLVPFCACKKEPAPESGTLQKPPSRAGARNAHAPAPESGTLQNPPPAGGNPPAPGKGRHQQR